MARIYLDNNATTCLDPTVYASYCKNLQSVYGNPSSIHSFGQEAKAQLIKSRQALADILGVRSQEIIFTSSATEALNLLLRGFFGPCPKGHMITSKAEHLAVYQTAQALQTQGLEVTYLDVSFAGAPTADALRRAIRPDTRLICLMAVNNETGVISDIETFAQIAQEFAIPLVVDGVALFGKTPFSLHPGVSAICFSGHKFHGPKGVGFAVIRKGFKLQPCLTGGSQEYGLRAGTENVPAIVAMTEAALITQRNLIETCKSIEGLRLYFEEQVTCKVTHSFINGADKRVCNTSNICFQGVDGEALLMYLDLHGVAASLGSACSSGAIEPSRVLLEMGLTRDQALSSLRFSFSRFTTKDEIDKTVEILSRFRLG